MDKRMYVKEGSSYSDFPVSVEKGAKGPRGIIIFLIIAFIAVLGFMGYRYIGGKNTSPKIAAIPTATPAPSEIPTATPVASPTASLTPGAKTTPTPTTGSSSTVDKATGLDRAALSVEIQNGSGVAGAAGKMSSTLTKLGYDVTGSGNADVFTYTDVTIKVKATKLKYLTLLKRDLGDVYTIGSATSDLPATNASDALIIVGK